MLLQKLKSGIYTGKIKTYNTRRSTRTGLTYLNLTVTIKANGQKVDFQKSYCLDPGKNMDIIEIMEAVDGVDADEEADFEKLYNHFFKVSIVYNKLGQPFIVELQVAEVVIVDGRKCSKPISKDKWCRHLVCECGSVYGKYKWRTNKNGEVSNGYQCRHQIRYRKRSFHEKQGLDGTGYCNVPSICEWKLDFMAKSILERLWKDQKSSVEELLQDIQDNYSEETGITDREYQIEKLKRESERLKNRMSNLVDMKLDDLIGSEEFEDKKCTIDERMLQIKNELAILSQDEEDNEPVEVEGEIKKIKEYLNGVCDLNQKQLSDELVDAVIARITPMENGAFKWYIQGEEYDTETSFDESKYVLYDRFTLNFEEAKKYRKAFGNFIRAVQWKDLIVEVYIRQD